MVQDGNLPLIIDGARTTRASVAELPKELTEALRTGEFHHALRLAIAYRGLSLARLRASEVERYLERIVDSDARGKPRRLPRQRPAPSSVAAS